MPFKPKLPLHKKSALAEQVLKSPTRFSLSAATALCAGLALVMAYGIFADFFMDRGDTWIQTASSALGRASPQATPGNIPTPLPAPPQSTTYPTPNDPTPSYPTPSYPDPECAFRNLPSDTRVVTVADSDHATPPRNISLRVNANHPVALLITAHSSASWTIDPASTAAISAIYLTGRAPQYLTNKPSATPTIFAFAPSATTPPTPHCPPYVLNIHRDMSFFDPNFRSSDPSDLLASPSTPAAVAHKIFNRPLSRIYVADASSNSLVINEPSPLDIPPEPIEQHQIPSATESEPLLRAMQQGILRYATPADIFSIYQAFIQKPGSPPFAYSRDAVTSSLHPAWQSFLRHAFVLNKPAHIPSNWASSIDLSSTPPSPDTLNVPTLIIIPKNTAPLSLPSLTPIQQRNLVIFDLNNPSSCSSPIPNFCP